VTSNLDFIMQSLRDPEMQRIHLEADLVVADGWPPVKFSGLFGPRLKGRVAGSDLVARMGAFARDQGLSLFGLGGQTGVAAQAMEILSAQSPGLKVAGTFSPPIAGLLDMDHAALRSTVSAAKPDVLLVAFGAPKQDKWIRMNLRRMGVPVCLGIGASLDFIVGVQTRAPRWVQSVGMEWFWRLCSQPRRLFKRYAANLVFLPTLLTRLALARMWPGGRPSCGPVPDPSVLAAKGGTGTSFRPLRTPEEVEAFCGPLEPAARDRALVVDLSERFWLSSLELGALARLARAAWAGRRRLLLSGVSRRLRRLLRLMRLDRWMEIPGSAEDWDRRLDEYSGPEGSRGSQWSSEGTTRRVLLAEEFEGEDAVRAEAEFVRVAAEAGVDRFILDGRRLRYIDSSGLLFLKNVWRSSGEGAGRGVSLRSFPEAILNQLRREGMSALASKGPEDA
jgi:N-acetylglucosaminyldiphosphoundecaprenol N-acetyl-beta-D-mannosaminyltransferase